MPSASSSQMNRSIAKNLREALSGKTRAARMVSFDEMNTIINAEAAEKNGISSKEVSDLERVYNEFKHRLDPNARLRLAAFLSRAKDRSFRDVHIIDGNDYYSEEDQGGKSAALFLRRQGLLVQNVVAWCVPGAILDVVYNFRSRTKRQKKIRALRFYGHGAPDLQCVGSGQNGNDPMTLLEVYQKRGRYRLRHRDTLKLLRPLLEQRKSHVELHGCQVAGGSSRLLVLMAETLRVPIVAGVGDQWASSFGSSQRLGAIETDLFFEGPKAVARPGDKEVQILR